MIKSWEIIWALFAKNKFNIDKLLEAIDYKLNGKKLRYALKIPNSDLKTYYYLYENRITSNEEYDENGINFDAILYENEINKYEKYIEVVY